MFQQTLAQHLSRETINQTLFHLLAPNENLRALAYLGWITIGPSALIVAFVLAMLMGIIQAKRKVQT